jgi:tRNA(His) guanylyltransferase
MGDLGDRMKGYEKTFSGIALKRTPLMIRVDGKAFHTFTKGFDKPFDKALMQAMVSSAMCAAKEMQGFKVAYIQSDEVTFCLTDYDTIETQGWFGYKIQKMVSISAALMTAAFNQNFKTDKTDKVPIFDSRAFSLPKSEVINAFLWRALDWKRNSLQMLCQSNFSHKEMHCKNQIHMHEMLHGIGKSWTKDLSEQERNGTFLIKAETKIQKRTDIIPNYDILDKEFGHLFL